MTTREGEGNGKTIDELIPSVDVVVIVVQSVVIVSVISIVFVTFRVLTEIGKERGPVDILAVPISPDLVDDT